MTPAEPKPSEIPNSDLLSYTQFPQVLRSWFWRYYDHLGHLVLYNLGWFLTLFAAAWLSAHFKLWISFSPDGPQVKPWGLYLIFMIESGLSIAWAYLIFRIFNLAEGSFLEAWKGAFHYLPKALGLSALSGSVLVLGFYNIRFYYLSGFSHVQNMAMAGVIVWLIFFWISAALYHWPILFFQDPPFLKILYRSFLLAMANGLGSLGIFLFLVLCFCLFSISIVLWFFLGFVFFFSFQCVLLEKHLLRYKITFGDKPLESFLDSLKAERQRGWRDFLKPWENR